MWKKRLVDSIVRRVDQMEGGQIARRGKSRKTIRESINQWLKINELIDTCSKPYLVG